MTRLSRAHSFRHHCRAHFQHTCWLRFSLEPLTTTATHYLQTYRLRQRGQYDPLCTRIRALDEKTLELMTEFFGLKFAEDVPCPGLVQPAKLPFILKTIITDDNSDLCSDAMDVLFRQFNQVGNE